MNDLASVSDTAFSLADLSDLNLGEISEFRFESLPAGVYGFKVVEADLDEKPNRDGDNRIVANFKLEIIEVKGLIGAKAKNIEPDSLLGKTHSERLFIVPDEGVQKVAEGAGRIKAFIWDMGCDDTGTLGDAVRNTVDHVFEAKIVERPNPNDRTSPFAQLKLEKRKR